MQALSAGQAVAVGDDYVDACRGLLGDESLDPAMVALMLRLPSEAYLAELISPVDVQAIHAAREAVRRCLADALTDSLLAAYRRCESNENRIKE